MAHPDPLTLTYLGVAGWHLQAGPGSLLIDPYLTRASLWQAAAGHVIPDRTRIMRHTPPAGTIIVTHGHYDHLSDVPVIAGESGAAVFASAQSCALLSLLGLSDKQLHITQPGDHVEREGLHITIHASLHRRILGRIPYQGPLRPGLRPPLRARDLRMDEQHSLHIVAGEVRLLVLSGIDEEPAPESEVVIVGGDASREQLARVLEPAAPRLVLPNHWDDMFKPLDTPTRPGRYPAFPLRRIDLAQFAAAVRAIAPRAQVLIPERLRPYDLHALPVSRGMISAG
ncbi:MAG: MBL fold metallo-hydrolase [Anaerolineae bacterium]